MKLYVDTTGELVIDAGNEAHYYPAFSEIKRVKVGADRITISHLFSNGWVSRINGSLFSDLEDSGGTAYASFALAWAAIDAYFDDVA